MSASDSDIELTMSSEDSDDSDWNPLNSLNLSRFIEDPEKAYLIKQAIINDNLEILKEILNSNIQINNEYDFYNYIILNTSGSMDSDFKDFVRLKRDSILEECIILEFPDLSEFEIFDPALYMDVPIKEFLLEDEDHIVFLEYTGNQEKICGVKIEDQKWKGYGYSRKTIDKGSVFVQCNKEYTTTSTVNPEDVDLENKYASLFLNYNVGISLKNINKIKNSSAKIFLLMNKKTISPIASIEAVQTEFKTFQIPIVTDTRGYTFPSEMARIVPSVDGLDYIEEYIEDDQGEVISQLRYLIIDRGTTGIDYPANEYGERINLTSLKHCGPDSRNDVYEIVYKTNLQLLSMKLI